MKKVVATLLKSRGSFQKSSFMQSAQFHASPAVRNDRFFPIFIHIQNSDENKSSISNNHNTPEDSCSCAIDTDIFSINDNHYCSSTSSNLAYFITIQKMQRQELTADQQAKRKKIADIESTKQLFFYSIERFEEIVQDINKRVPYNLSELSYLEILSKKTSLIQDLQTLVNKQKFLTQENPKVCNLLKVETSKLHVLTKEQIRNTWSHMDLIQAYDAVLLKAEIEAKKIEIHKCTKTVEKIGQEATSVAQNFQDAPPLSAREKDKQSELITNFINLESSIADQEKKLEEKKAMLDEINKKLAALKGSFFEKILASASNFPNMRTAEKCFKTERETLQVSIKNIENYLQYFYDQKKQ